MAYYKDGKLIYEPGDYNNGTGRKCGLLTHEESMELARRVNDEKIKRINEAYEKQRYGI